MNSEFELAIKNTCDNKSNINTNSVSEININTCLYDRNSRRLES